MTTATTIRMTGSRFTTTPSQNEPIQNRKIARQHSEPAKHKQKTQRDQHRAAPNFHCVHVAPKSTVELHEAFNQECRQQKWYGKSQRVNAQQQDSLCY